MPSQHIQNEILVVRAKPIWKQILFDPHEGCSGIQAMNSSVLQSENASWGR